MYVGGKEANKHKGKKLNAGRGAVGKTAVLGMREKGGCKWPLWGSAERPTHTYCDAPRDGDGPYCAAHHAQAISHRERAA